MAAALPAALTQADVDRLARRLAPTGLNRCQAVAVSELDASVWLPGSRPDWAAGGVRGHHGALVLVGHAGRALWRHLHDPDSGFDFADTPDPVDTFSIDTTAAALGELMPALERRLLYPQPDCPVDLVALGRALGWHTPSPLGLGVSPGYGLWSAFRALWLVSSPSPPDLVGPPRPADVCATCSTQDCVQVCPAKAVVHGSNFDLMRCGDYRSKQESACAETCLSRMACPVGAEHRYLPDQLTYHYRLSRPPTTSASGR